MKPEERLLLSNQLCFPIYRCARRIIRAYAPLLKDLGLTYTQYIVMMVMWERRRIEEKELCALLDLDSGTLSPLIRKLAARSLVTKRRLESDARVLVLEATDEGMALREKALKVPVGMACAMKLKSDEEALDLKERVDALSRALEDSGS
ncbi:MAG: MarR family winged helix-turn-helix transcriptional regulator [Succinivibrio sp.]